MNKILALTVLVLDGFASSQPQKVRLKPKIIGGVDAKKNELPYQVSLQQDNSHVCGGSIINENYILTAGHCVYGTDESRVTVIAGEHNISSPTNDGTEQFGSVAEIKIHENYKSHNSSVEYYENDIALLKLSSPLKLNDAVEPIALPKQGNSATGMALVSGWGYIAGAIPAIPAILQKVTVPIMTKEDCKTAYGDRVAQDTICTGYPEGGKGPCWGDSGSPLVAYDDDGPSYLAGVVSWGEGEECAADVSRFVTWINQKMGSGQVVF